MKELLIKHGAPQAPDAKKKDKGKKQNKFPSRMEQSNNDAAEQNQQRKMPVIKENELQKVKEFSLQIKDGEQFRPIT